MAELGDIERARMAHGLVRAGLRISIVHLLTDVSLRTLRVWWKEEHRTRPPNGKMPETVLHYTKSRKNAALLSTFVSFWKRRNGVGRKTISAQTVLETWHEYRQYVSPIDINAAYCAVRDVFAGIVVISRCDKCGAEFIYDAGSQHTDHCPFCKTPVIPREKPPRRSPTKRKAIPSQPEPNQETDPEDFLADEEQLAIEAQC